MKNPKCSTNRTSRAALLLMLGLVYLAPAAACGEESSEITLPGRDQFHLFLLAGQSNMAGRGEIDAQDRITHPRVLTLSPEGRWIAATDPLHFDGSNGEAGGVGLGRTFGIEWARRNPDVTVGLIPCAVGGTSITQWVPGGIKRPHNVRPYDDAIARAKQAIQHGALKGILWHQGEADCHQLETAKAYEANMTALIARMRNDLGGGDLPFIIGQLGQFKKEPWSGWNVHRAIVDQAHQKVAKSTKYCSFVRSDDLTDKGDNLHFDAKSLREFGGRYADALMLLSQE